MVEIPLYVIILTLILLTFNVLLVIMALRQMKVALELGGDAIKLLGEREDA